MQNAIWLCLTGFVILVSILIYLYRFKGALFSHFTIIAAVCFLVEVFAPMVWLVRGQTAYRALEVMKYTPKASFFFIIGYLAFCFVFFSMSPKKENWRELCPAETKTEDIRVGYMWLLYAFFFVLYWLYLSLRGRSLLSQLTLGQQGDYSADIMSSTNASLWFLMVSLNSLVCISVLLLFYQKKSRWAVYVCYAVTLLLTISAGYRHLMIDMILAPFIVRTILKKKKYSLIPLVVMALVLYLTVSWIGAMRGVYRTGVGELTAYESKSAFESFMINIEVFFPYFAYVNYIPNFGYFSYGGTYLAGILQLIPSAIWPGKGSVVSAIRNDGGYKGMLAGMENEGIADTFWCEGYKNGGLFGIVVVFGILGGVAAKLRKLQYSERVSDVVLFALSTTFMFQVMTRSFQNMLQDCLFLFLPIFMLRWMTGVKWNQKG